jgi:hypothetical protein
VRYDKPIAAIIWPPVSLLHRQIVPRLLRRAAALGKATQRTDSGRGRTGFAFFRWANNDFDRGIAQFDSTAGGQLG